VSALDPAEIQRLILRQQEAVDAAQAAAEVGDYASCRRLLRDFADMEIGETWGPWQADYDQHRANALAERCLERATIVMAGMVGRARATERIAVEKATDAARGAAREQAAPLQAAFDCAHDLMLAVFEAGLAVDDLGTPEIQRTAADLLTHFPDIAAMFDEED